MDRLQPSPTGLPLRAWCLISGAAVVLLLIQGGSWADVPRLLSGTLVLEEGGRGFLHALLVRALHTFALASGALIFGASVALAVTCLSSALGVWGRRTLGWAGRLLGGVPAMAWALLATVLFIQHWQVPVETLFPFQPPAEQDSFFLRLGRSLWSGLLPASVLGIPVFGMILAALCQKLGEVSRHEEVRHIRARGLTEWDILHQHLMPHLLLHLVRQARICLPLLLAFSVPVEDILGYNGLGRAVAQTMTTGAFPKTLPAALYFCGWMLLPWLVLLSWLERKSPVSAVEAGFVRGTSRSLSCTVAGGLLLLLMMTLPYALPYFAEAHVAWTHEIWQALKPVLVAGALAVLSIPAWLLWDRLRPEWHLGLVPAVASGAVMFLVLLLSAPLWAGITAATWGVGAVLSLSAMAALRQDARAVSALPMVEAARMLGTNAAGILHQHLVRFLAPALGNWALRMLPLTLLLNCFVRYYLPGAGEPAVSWGAQMRLASEGIFDDAGGVVAPAVLLALWCLSFHLLSRAFRTDLPAQEIPNANPR